MRKNKIFLRELIGIVPWDESEITQHIITSPLGKQFYENLSSQWFFQTYSLQSIKSKGKLL